MPLFQQAIVCSAWNWGAHGMVQEFRSNPVLRPLAMEPWTGHGQMLAVKGVVTSWQGSSLGGHGYLEGEGGDARW
jgi:hypothetical protein